MTDSNKNESDQPKPDQQPSGEQPGADQNGAIAQPKTGELTGKVDKKKMAQFVTEILNAEEQVGRHIINALQHDDTVAVITTVAVGPDGNQRVVSAALSPERMKQVQEILTQAEQEREDEEPCVGFHCLVKRKAV